uniref:Uncharacterized protein n=1 Tax=Panagrolaimus davidi TaxID=227884 RepID=A0A914QM45_9BILA
MTYLRQWLDPSFSQSGDFIPLSIAQQQQADQALQSTFITGSRVQRLQQIMNQCQDVINSCTFAGQTISSYECCQFVQLYSGTLKGICWIFDNPAMSQQDYDLSKGFQITFQVTRNSFYNSENVTVHPGIDIYLMNNSMDSTRFATEMASPITIKDKENVRAKIKKQYTSNLQLSHCGSSPSNAAEIDRQKSQSSTSLSLCLLTAAASECGCFPLWASFIPLNSQRYLTLSQQINQTTACSVTTYESCARKYMEYSQSNRWKEPPRPNSNAIFVNAVKNCRSQSHTPCQTTEYPAEIERNSMPREFQTSSDYVSRITVVYSSLEITNIAEERDPNFYYLLSYIGYNAALWFAIGHIIW